MLPLHLPVVAYSERPDKVASKILCGRVALSSTVRLCFSPSPTFLSRTSRYLRLRQPLALSEFVRLLRLFSFLVSIFTVVLCRIRRSTRAVAHKLAMTIALPEWPYRFRRLSKHCSLHSSSSSCGKLLCGFGVPECGPHCKCPGLEKLR